MFFKCDRITDACNSITSLYVILDNIFVEIMQIVLIIAACFPGELPSVSLYVSGARLCFTLHTLNVAVCIDTRGQVLTLRSSVDCTSVFCIIRSHVP